MLFSDDPEIWLSVMFIFYKELKRDNGTLVTGKLCRKNFMSKQKSGPWKYPMFGWKTREKGQNSGKIDPENREFHRN